MLSSSRAQGTPRLVLDLKNIDALEQTVIFLFSDNSELSASFEHSFDKIDYLNIPMQGKGKFFSIIHKIKPRLFYRGPFAPQVGLEPTTP